MDLDRYARETRGHCIELVEALEAAGIEAAFQAGRRLGADGFLRYIADNEAALLALAGQAPAARKKTLARLRPEDRPLFLLGALYLARLGASLLELICQRGIAAGASYRSLTERASDAGWEFRTHLPTLWPFEDREDPFQDAC